MLCNLIRQKNILVSSLITLVIIKKIIDKCQPICHEFDPFGDCWKEIMFKYLNDRSF